MHDGSLAIDNRLKIYCDSLHSEHVAVFFLLQPRDKELTQKKDLAVEIGHYGGGML